MYKTVFDLAAQKVDFMKEPLPLIYFFLAAGLIMILFQNYIISKSNSRSKVLLVGSGMTVMSTIFLLIFLVPQFIQPRRARSILRNGNYKIVEGRPENYHPMPEEGHDLEKFDIQHAHFEFGDYHSAFGYNNAASHGGVIHSNQYYRLTYFYRKDIGNRIIRIEVRE